MNSTHVLSHLTKTHKRIQSTQNSTFSKRFSMDSSLPAKIRLNTKDGSAFKLKKNAFAPAGITLK